MPRSGGKKPTFPGLYNRHLDEMRSLLNTLDPGVNHDDEGVMSAPMDLYETESEVVFEFDLPGLLVENISLVQRGMVLFLEVEKLADTRPGHIRYICLERHFGRFRRSVRMPDQVDPLNVRAEYRKGVLKVFCPKGRERRISIKESGSEQV